MLLFHVCYHYDEMLNKTVFFGLYHVFMYAVAMMKFFELYHVWENFCLFAKEL